MAAKSKLSWSFRRQAKKDGYFLCRVGLNLSQQELSLVDIVISSEEDPTPLRPMDDENEKLFRIPYEVLRGGWIDLLGGNGSTLAIELGEYEFYSSMWGDRRERLQFSENGKKCFFTYSEL